MVTAAAVVTGVVVMANVAVLAAAATVTDAGTDAAVVLLLTSDTTAPPTGAAALRVTVPVLPAPPVTDAGFSVTDANGEIGRASWRGRGEVAGVGGGVEGRMGGAGWWVG